MSHHSHSPPRRSSPLVLVSAAAMFIFSLLFGLGAMFGIKMHIHGASAYVVGALIILTGIAVAIGAIIADRNS